MNDDENDDNGVPPSQSLPIEQQLPDGFVRVGPVDDEARRRMAEKLANRPALQVTLGKEQERFVDVLTRRRRVGYVLGSLSISMLVAIAILDFVALHWWIPVPENAFQERRVWLIVAGQSVVTIAVVYFAYQLLRAAERLVMPYWWVERHAAAARLMLGVPDPASVPARLLREIRELLTAVGEAKK